jgi:hypothetical protein
LPIFGCAFSCPIDWGSKVRLAQGSSRCFTTRSTKGFRVHPTHEGTYPLVSIDCQ